MNNNTLISYIRDENKTPRGVVVAVKKDGEVFYGFSLRNPIDKWDKKLGIKKAIARAEAGEYQLPSVPSRLNMIVNAYQKMEERAIKYFKNIPQENIKLYLNVTE